MSALAPLLDGWPRPETGPAPELRPYQIRAVEAVEAAYAAGKRAPLLALATGAGKTVVAAELIRRAEAKGQTALFLAPRRELVHQASWSLAQIGLDHGVVLAGREDLESHWDPVQVGSIDTLVARVLRRGRRPFPDPDLIVIDEAHLSITKTRQDLVALWPEARLLGLTATPARKDGRALGLFYDALIEPVTVADLTAEGYLTPARYFSISEPDLAKVGFVAGDYNQRQLDQAVNQPSLVGDIVATWLVRAAERRTVVFATSIQHSVALAEAFSRAGVAAAHVDAATPVAERTRIFERFAAGEIQVLTNCFLAAVGYDLPRIDCVVLARPTRSLTLYLQMLGRGLRPAKGKRDCLVLDHAGAVHRHGFATEPRAWSLSGKMALVVPSAGGPHRGDAGMPKQIDCPECSAVFTGSRTCPECGYYLAPVGRQVETIDGKLVEIGAGLLPEEVDRQAFFLELRGFAKERGYKPGWAAHRFKARFGKFPPRDWNDRPILTPSLATRRWIKSQQIAWAKAQQKREASA